MDKTLWMTITSLVMGIMGFAFILVSIFDSGAGNSVLMIGMLFVALGNLLNAIRIRRNKRV